MISGLYYIINKINNNIYVGISINIEDRWKRHKQDLIKGYNNRFSSDYELNLNRRIRHHQLNLQNEFNEYYNNIGEKVWNEIYNFKIIINVNNYKGKEFKIIEDEHILKLRESNFGYFQLTNEEIKHKYYWKFENNSYKPINEMEKHKEEIIDMYVNKKISMCKISKLFKVYDSTILYNLDKWGVKRRSISESINGFDIEEFKKDIIDLYLHSNLTLGEIGKKYKLSNECIRYNLKRWHIKVKDKPREILETNKNKVVELLNEGIPLKDMSLYFEINIYTLKSFLLSFMSIEEFENYKTISRINYKYKNTKDINLFIKENVNKIINMYNNHMSIKKISENLNIKYTNLVSYLNNKLNIHADQSISTLGFNINIEKDNIINMYVNKYISTNEIAKFYNISSTTIKNYLKLWNITLRSSTEHFSKRGRKDNVRILVINISDNSKHIFDTIIECGNWMIENNLINSIKSVPSTIYRAFDNNKPYKGYLFKKLKKYEEGITIEN